MSKERELLKKLLVSGIFRSGLYEDWGQCIKELLDQPEQSSTTRQREPLSDGEVTTNTPKTIPLGERLAFHAGIRWAEHQHGIGVDDEQRKRVTKKNTQGYSIH